MKRVGNLFEVLISDETLYQAIYEVNKSHRWNPHHKPNKTVEWVEKDIPGHVQELREIIVNGFVPSPVKKKRRYDRSAGKWRDIADPKLWPDQYVHHVLIITLQPVFMRGMDKWCCGSIKGRGTHYGMKAIKKWMKDKKSTKFSGEGDIYHFYDSLTKEAVMQRMRQLVKDYLVLDLIERILSQGVLIGCYCSQWFANVVLQPLDTALRKSGYIKHSTRYMDNFTLFGSNKRKMHKAFHLIDEWLHAHGLRLKENWQVFRADIRLPAAFGYRFGRGYTILRKKTLLRLKRIMQALYKKISRGVKISPKLANGIISRVGQLKRCNSVEIRKKLIKRGIIKMLKNIVRKKARKESRKWNMSLEEMEQRSFSVCAAGA